MDKERKERKERTLPIEEPVERVLDAYLETRRERFPGVKLGPHSAAVRRPPR